MNASIPDVFFPIVTMTIATVIAAYSWRRSRTIAMILFGWGVVSLFTARIPYFESVESWTDGESLGPLVFNAVSSIPIILLFIAAWRSPAFKRFMRNTPSWVLTATQLYRLAGGVLLVLYLDGILPAEIGITNGVMDIIVGLTAIPMAWALYRGLSWSRNVAIAWNVFGLLDFVAAGVILSLSQSGELVLSPSPAQMGMYPLTLITVYQVAIATFIHFFLLGRLFRTDVSPVHSENTMTRVGSQG
ncbi:MAG: hypothetical protein AAF125_16470 [Chloroflexota bacterium]